MPSPFPGMDPYLEAPDLWPDVHHLLISTSVEQLQPRLLSRGYYAAIEVRVWIEFPERSVYPDVSLLKRRPARPKRPEKTKVLVADEPVRLPLRSVERREAYLQVHDVASRSLVTGIEFLSPSNKARTEARTLYKKKRAEFIQGGVNLVEVDLLRAGRPLLRLPRSVTHHRSRNSRYLINIVRPASREYEYYPVSLRQRLPRSLVPLRLGEVDEVLDLQDVLRRAYEVGAYATRIDYNGPPDPPLVGDDAAWAQDLLAKARSRTPTP